MKIRIPVWDKNKKLKTIKVIEKPEVPVTMQFSSVEQQLQFDGELQMIDDSQIDQRVWPRSY